MNKVLASIGNADADFLLGGGDMGAMMRSIDWSETPMGAVEFWPQSLRTAISIMLASRFAMAVAWGEEFHFFYNDRYRPILGASKHPGALGSPAHEIFPEAWPFIGPLFESTRQGESVALDDVMIPLDRYGYLENCYFTLSYSPIRDESGGVGGMLAVVAETTERVRIETALRESEERYRHLVQSLPAAVYTIDMQGRITLYNEAAAALWGQEPQLGEDSWCGSYRIYRPDGTPLPLDKCPMAVSLEEGRPVRGEEIIIERPDGSRRNILPHPEPIRNASGAMVGAINMLIDITHYRQAEQSLRESEERFAKFMQHLPGLSWIKDLEGRYIFVNSAAERAFRRSRAELYGKTDEEIFPPETARQFRQNDRRAIAGATGVETVETLEHDDGIHHSIVSKFPIPGSDGAPTLVGGIAIDITERIKIEQALSESEERFRTLATNAPVAIFMKDLDGRYTLANPLACQALGRPDGATGLTDHEILPADVADQLRRHDLEVIGTGRALEREEVVQRDAWRRDFLSVKFPLLDAEGRAVGVCGVAVDITERKLAEKAMRESEERLRLATQTGKVGVWDWDIITNRVTWTDSLYTIHGVKPNQFDATVGGFESLVHPGDRDFVSESIRRALEDDAPYELEFRAVRPDGEVIWLFTTAVILRDGLRPTRMLGATLDITQSKRVEVALRESEERFRTLTSFAPVGIFLTNLNGDCLFVNRRWCDMAGLTMQEAEGKGWTKALHPDDRERVTSEWYRSVQKGVPFISEYRFLRPDGTVTWLHGSAVELRNAESLIIGHIGAIADITESKHAEAALRESEARFRNLANNAPVLIWVNGMEGCEFVNHEYLRFVECEFEELLGMKWTRLLHPDDMEDYLDTYRRAFEQRELFQAYCRFRRADGEYRWLRSRGVPRFDAEGVFLGYVGCSVDISDIKKSEEALKEADRRKDEFLATLAHELRNPLAPIQNAVQIMQMTSGDTETLEQARVTMQRQLNQMVRLIDDLLDVSRISRGKITLRKEQTELSAIVQNALEISQPIIKQFGHKLTITLPSEPVFIEADITRLAQVFANLLNNAAKYTEHGGHISLSVERQGSQVAVSVKDDGIGIPAQMLPQVFEMFTQGDHSLEKSHSGLGVGLSIVKSLVDMHGGTVEASSAGHGFGSEFTVRLPVLVSPTSESRPSGDDQESLSASARRRILVADDNEDAATTLAMVLELMGNEVRVVNDGLEAVEKAAEFKPELILLDIGMPRMNGYEACRRIREERGDSEVVIVALTGWGQDEDKQRSKDAGFDHHLVKPVDPEELEKLLAELQAETG